MVMETLVEGAQRSKPAYRIIRVLPVEGDAVKCGGKAFGAVVLAEVVEAAVGPLRGPLAGKLPLRILLDPLEGEDPGGVGERARQVFLHAPRDDLPPLLVIGERDPGNAGAGERRGVQLGPYFLVAHPGYQGVLAIGGLHRRPGFDDPARLLAELRLTAGNEPVHVRNGSGGGFQHGPAPLELEQGAGDFRLLRDGFAVAARRLDNLSQVVDPVGRNDVFLQAFPFGDLQRRLRRYCLRTLRNASSDPLRSNLLRATRSAKSSISIFSSWVGAPNSQVMT